MAARHSRLLGTRLLRNRCCSYADAWASMCLMTMLFLGLATAVRSTGPKPTACSLPAAAHLAAQPAAHAYSRKAQGRLRPAQEGKLRCMRIKVALAAEGAHHHGVLMRASVGFRRERSCSLCHRCPAHLQATLHSLNAIWLHCRSRPAGAAWEHAGRTRGVVRGERLPSTEHPALTAVM